MVTVLTPAQNTSLTTLAAVKAALAIADSDINEARDARLESYIVQASAAIADLIGYPLWREEVSERLPGSGRTTQLLWRTPVAGLLEVEYEESILDPAVDPVNIIDARAGMVWREPGFPSTQPIEIKTITPQVLPQLGTQPWVFRYLGGFLLASDNFSASGLGLTAAGVLTVSGMRAPLLASGEMVRLRGWSASANNGRFRVLARDSETLTLEGTFEDETGGASALVEVATMPEASVLEGMALDAVKSWYLGEERDPEVQGERIGDWSATYRTPSGSSGSARLDRLPQRVADAIEARWRREA